LNIAKKSYSKISITQQLLFVVFASKKQLKPVGKSQKFEKIQPISDDDILKKFGKMHKF